MSHPSYPGGQFSFRDVTPKDFYFLSYLDEELKCNDLEKAVRLVCRLLLDPSLDKEILHLTLRDFNSLSMKVFQHILKDKIMATNEWLELAFHLGKQRWGQHVDWLESQPMSKISVMMNVQIQHAKKMEQDAKSKR